MTYRSRSLYCSDYRMITTYRETDYHLKDNRNISHQIECSVLGNKYRLLSYSDGYKYILKIINDIHKRDIKIDYDAETDYESERNKQYKDETNEKFDIRSVILISLFMVFLVLTLFIIIRAIEKVIYSINHLETIAIIEYTYTSIINLLHLNN